MTGMTITSIVPREEVFELFNFLDQEEVHFMNSSLNIAYRWKDYLSAGVVLRYDGATTVQSNHRWLFTPAAQVQWSIKHSLLENVSWLSRLDLYGSWARVGRYLPSVLAVPEDL